MALILQMTLRAFSWANYGSVNPKPDYDAALDPKALAAYAKNMLASFYIVGVFQP